MKVFSGISISIIVFVLLLGCFKKQKNIVFADTKISIIPKPKTFKLGDGFFTFNKKTRFWIADDSQKPLIQLLGDKFKLSAGWELAVVTKAPRPKANYIRLTYKEDIAHEAYELEVGKKAVILLASSYSGFLYGIETLRQMLPTAIESKQIQKDVIWAIPEAVIKDSPRFRWRGLMLDLSRHFFDKEFLKAIIGELAMLKMNILHLHLVDDQGWRIEIKKYPKLTEIGAFRVDQEHLHWNARSTPKPTERPTLGGYLTQDDIKEIVVYAHQKGITVVPEIEMPAHVMSAIAAYPQLSCKGKSIMVPSGGVWPITEIYCAGKEFTFTFLEDVLAEVVELFPSPYIHVGGDEATKTNWKICRYCQNRIKKEGLKNVEELQSYFIKRMERFLNEKGKILIGWDEILEGGLAPRATVMSWRGFEGGLKASAEGHDVVMTPVSHCYFDYYQGKPNSEPLAIGGYISLSKAYEFDPVIPTMTPQQIQHVLGGQANLWTEYITDKNHAQYMLYPRLAALAEAVWSPKKGRDKKDFFMRIKNLLKRYDYLGINYAKSAFDITSDSQVDMDNNQVHITLSNEFSSSNIRYILGDGDLVAQGIPYENPILIKKTTVIKAALFEKEKLVGKVFEKEFKYHKAVGRNVYYTKMYSDKYQGAKEVGLVNILRGSKNFRDGHWQAWLGDDMEVTIDMGKIVSVSSIVLGSMENQGQGIYFPIQIEAFISKDGKTFTGVGKINRPFIKNGFPKLRDFAINFEEQQAAFVKVKATNLKTPPSGGDAWLFVDEIIVKE